MHSGLRLAPETAPYHCICNVMQHIRQHLPPAACMTYYAHTMCCTPSTCIGTHLPLWYLQPGQTTIRSSCDSQYIYLAVMVCTIRGVGIVSSQGLSLAWRALLLHLHSLLNVYEVRMTACDASNFNEGDLQALWPCLASNSHFRAAFVIPFTR